MKIPYLFVYGSLRKAVGHPAFSFIEKYFNYVSEAKTKGILYNLVDFPAAIETTEDKYIIGELYTIKNPDEFKFALAQLDDYEGVLNDDEDTPLYKRVALPVITSNNEEIIAWMYFYNRDIGNAAVIASGDILDFKNHH